MTENMFESMVEKLKTDVSKEIAYSYAVFVPNDTQRVISIMKRNIPLTDRKFLEQGLQKNAGNNLIFPYDILNSSLEKHIADFYDELNLSVKTAEKLSVYGSRGEKFKKEFNDRLNQSKTSTIKRVIHEMNLQMMQSKDAKSAIDHMQKVLTKRLSSLKNFLKSSAGQLEQYMVLWDYQDKGYTHYRIRANGDNCKECSELDGKIFPIYEAESGINLAPIHPNCDCSLEVLDENGDIVALVERTTEDEKNADKLEYLQASLKQVILGNYTDDVNLLGTLGQILLGLSGFDLPADIRDLVYDVTNFEISPKHLLQTLLDIVAVLPVVGGIKYIDEAGDVLKDTAKYGDEVAETGKGLTKVIKYSNITDNIEDVVKRYKLNESGYFGEKGKNCRIIKSDDPIETSADFYKKISQGGTEIPLANKKGVQTIFDDDSRVIYRVKTSTPNSPAVNIQVVSAGRIKTQKIHFIEEK